MLSFGNVNSKHFSRKLTNYYAGNKFHNLIKNFLQYIKGEYACKTNTIKIIVKSIILV